MIGLWLENQQLSLRKNLPLPTPPQGEALIKIIRAGICNTDVELLRGYYSYAGVLGHEFVGVVESDGEWKGKRVVGEINARCGKCEACLNKNRNHCESRTVLGIQDRNGVFADYTTLPYENLHEVPHNVSDDEAVFTEPLAAALQIPQQIQIHPEDRVVLIGDGKLGLLCAQVVALSGCDLTVIGKHENKLEILKRRGIKTAIWNPKSPTSDNVEDVDSRKADIANPKSPTSDNVEDVDSRKADIANPKSPTSGNVEDVDSRKADIANPKSPTSGDVEDVDSQKADIVVEVTGSSGGFEIARGLLRGGGRLVLKSTYAGKLTLDISSIVVDEITIIGSRCGPFKAALDLLSRKLIDVGSLVHARYKLDEAVTAMEKAQEAGVLKVLLDVN